MTSPGGIQNRDALVDDSRNAARAAALDIASAGLATIDPAAATTRIVIRRGEALEIDGRVHDLAGRRVYLLGAGKATLSIGGVLASLLGDHLSGGLLVAPGGNSQTRIPGVEVVESDHPVPTSRSVMAGNMLLDMAKRVEPGDVVLCCFTGGSSALASVPADGISALEKREVNEILLSSGLDIVKTNTVRKHTSQIKGGRLAALMSGASIVNLTVPDVAGNHLDSITDPTVQDTSSPSDAIKGLTDAGLWAQMPPSVKHHLERKDPAPDLSSIDIQTVLVSTGNDACSGMVDRAEHLGYSALAISTDWSGEAVENGTRAGRLVVDCLEGRGPLTPPCVLVACGGESTVTLGDWAFAGRGGPNQEFSLAAARVVAGRPEVAVLAIDTDGSDGSTVWAGALSDGATASLVGLSELDTALDSHNSTSALRSSGDLISTGQTMTNVNDLYVLVVGTTEHYGPGAAHGVVPN